MENGKKLGPSPTLNEAAARSAAELKLLPEGCHRLVNPHTYKVSISRGLNELRLKMMTEVQGRLA